MSKVFEIAFRLGAEVSSSFKGAFKEAGSTMNVLAGAAAAIGGTAVFATLAGQVSEMNDSLAKLSAQTGTYGADMAELGDIAKNVFRSGYGESFDEVTEAIANVKQNMQNLDNGELERMTSHAMIFADTFDADINEITRAANNMMTNFGIESTKAMDLFAAGAQRGLNFSDEMLDNVAEYAPLFAQMGYSAEEYFGIMERGSKAGVYNLDYVNDVMKEFQIRVKDGSKATNDAMNLLSKDTQNVWKEFLKGNGTVADVSSTVVSELQGMEDQILAGQLAVSLFGVKWEDLESDAMYAMLGTQEAMKGFEGAMEKVNEVRFDTFGQAIKGIGRILFMDLVYPMGEALLPALNKTANFLESNLPGAISGTVAVLKTVTPVVLGIVSALLVYRGTLFAISTAQVVFNAVQKISIALYHAHRAAMIGYALAGGGIKGVIAGIRAAMVALNVTMLANPFVAVAAALVGLTVAFIAAYKMSDRFRGAVNNAFAGVRDFVINTTNFVATNAVSIWNGLIESARELPSRLQSALSESKIGQMISNLFSNNEGIMDGLINSIKTGFSSLPGIFSMIAPTLTTLGLSFLGVSGPIGWLIGAVVSIGGFLFRLSQTNEGVASAIANAWSSVKEAFAPIMQVFSDAAAQFAAEVGPQLGETMQVIAESVSALGPSFAELGATFGEVGALLISSWVEVASVVATTVLPSLLQVFQAVFPMIVSIVTTVVPLIAQVLMSIIPIILNLAQMVIPLILMVVQQVFPVVLAIIQAVLPIVAQLLVTVVQVILQLASTVLPILLQIVQMVFPIVLQIIQMVIPIVVMVLQTLVAVINGVIIPAINGILAVIQFVFPYVQMIIQNALAIVNGIIQTAMALLRGDWDGAWDAIKGTAETIMDNIISFFKGINLFEVGKSVITGLIDGIKSMGGKIVGAITDMIPAPIRGAASKLLGSIPGFAKGGIVSAPTLAWIGEGGDTETVIPWNNSDRSKQLWLQTGQELGMFGDAGLLSGIQQQANRQNTTPTASTIRPNQVRTAGEGSMQVQIIQQYHVNGNNTEEMQQVVAQGNDDLLSKLKQIQKDERRLAF